MSKVTLTAQLNKQVLDEAQQVIDAGHFKDLDALLDMAVRTFVLKYQRASSSLASRTLQAMMDELDPLEREQFNLVVESYNGVAGHPTGDEGMIQLLTMFKVYHAKRMLDALDKAQESKVPLSPEYLETIVERAERGKESREGAATARVRVDMRDPLLAEVATLYQKEIGELSEKVADQLRMLVEEFPDLERWHQAFEAAATMNKRNLRYVIGCLRNNGQKKAERQPYGKGKGRVSKSERHRETKRARNKDYDEYWDAKLKDKQNAKRPA